MQSPYPHGVLFHVRHRARSSISVGMVSVPVTGLFVPSWPHSEYLACDSSELGFHRPPWPPASFLIEFESIVLIRELVGCTHFLPHHWREAGCEVSLDLILRPCLKRNKTLRNLNK